MEPDQQQQPFDPWLLSWPVAESTLVDYSNLRCSPYPTVLDLSSSPPSAQTPSTPPENLSFSFASPWSSTDQIQPLLSSYSVQYPDFDRGSAHDPVTAVSTLTLEPYSAIQEQFYNAPWRQAGEIEPKDPTTGRSVLHALLEELTNGSKGRISKCRLCNRSFSRADRAITHLRHKHLDHRPFWCEGGCGTRGCKQRFHSQENLTPHVKPKIASCPRCPYKCLRQNMKRHIQKYHLEKLGI